MISRKPGRAHLKNRDLSRHEEKLERKHDGYADEVHDVLQGKPRIEFAQKGHVPGEDIYLALGRTFAGRYLSIFFIFKNDGSAVIISARDMAAKERRRYGKK